MRVGVGLTGRNCWGTLTLLLALAVPSAAQVRVVAIGDIHGAYPQFVDILQRTGIIDVNRQWTGGATILAQTGDVPSRGTQTRQCLDLLMELERQAVKQKGQVIPLLGNHEVMVMMGDLRYASPEEFQAFATERSEKKRERAYKQYVRFVAERNRRRPPTTDNQVPRNTWMAEHPLGFFEYRDAFGPKGRYGRWLRKHDTVAQLGDVLFLHGGLNPERNFWSIRKLNDGIRSELARFDFLWQSLSAKKIIWRYMRLEEAIREVKAELAAGSSLDQVKDFDRVRDLDQMEDPHQAVDPHTIQIMQQFLGLHTWMSVSPDGPLWYRGYAREPEEKLTYALQSMMSRLKVRHIVAAHTITDSRRITSRFNSRVFLIDTAMMLEEGRQGWASALEIENGRYTAYYSNGDQQVLLVPEGGGTVPALGQGQGSGKSNGDPLP